jgi:hypothetical protein
LLAYCHADFIGVALNPMKCNLVVDISLLDLKLHYLSKKRSETAFVVAVKEREQTRPDILSYEKALCMKQIKGE